MLLQSPASSFAFLDPFLPFSLVLCATTRIWGFEAEGLRKAHYHFLAILILINNNVVSMEKQRLSRAICYSKGRLCAKNVAFRYSWRLRVCMKRIMEQQQW